MCVCCAAQSSRRNQRSADIVTVYTFRNHLHIHLADMVCGAVRGWGGVVLSAFSSTPNKNNKSAEQINTQRWVWAATERQKFKKIGGKWQKLANFMDAIISSISSRQTKNWKGTNSVRVITKPEKSILFTWTRKMIAISTIVERQLLSSNWSSMLLEMWFLSQLVNEMSILSARPTALLTYDR